MEIDQGLYWALMGHALLLGVLLGAVYDGLRAVRIALGGGGVAVFACDLIFGAAACFGVVLLFFYRSDGVVRWFGLVGVAVGLWLYLCTVGKVTVRVMTAAVSVVKKLLRTVFRLIFAPIFFVGRLIFSSLYGRIKTVYRKRRRRRERFRELGGRKSCKEG